MSHALVCRLENVQKHPNADRLQVATTAGCRVVVSANAKDGDLMLFFPSDVILSHEYCENNNLYRKQDEKGKQIGGFFDPDRRVRCLSMRGVKTEGYAASLSSLAFCGSIADLREGDRLQAWQGVPLCTKYLTPATRRLRDRIARASQGKIRELPAMPMHFETEPLKRMLATVPPSPGLIVITEKLHGTSGRSTRTSVPVEPAPSFWPNPFRWLMWTLFHSMYGLVAPSHLMQKRVVNGSRRVLFLDEGDTGWYGDERFRHEAIASASAALKDGEAWYYEIVGHLNKREGDEASRFIMEPQPTKKSNDPAIRAYGDTMRYRYGCSPHQAACFVYRITEALEDAPPRDLPYSQMVKRAAEVGLKTPPLVTAIQWSQNVKETLAAMDLDALASGPSLLDPTHIREGVCVRVEMLGETDVRIYKVKSHAFGVLEGYLKDNDDYADTEEANG